MSRKLLLILIIVIIGLCYFVFRLQYKDNFLLGLLGIAGIYLIKILFDSYVTDLFKKILIWFRLFPSKNSPKITSKEIERAKKILRGKALQQSSQTIKELNNGDIEFIKELNWLFNPDTNYTTRHQGTLKDIFRVTKKDRYQGFVVIGEAGVGKTFSIHKYVLDLIDELKMNNDNDFVPVYFSLSRWSNNLSLKQWMISEMSKWYIINKKIAADLIDSSQIMPILDGLDQMPKIQRNEVLKGIEELAEIACPYALITRPDEYDEMKLYLEKKKKSIEKIIFPYYLLPLENSQVDEIIHKVVNGKDLNSLYKKNSKLKNFIRYPLSLNLFCFVIKRVNTDDEILNISSSDKKKMFSLLWKKYESIIFEDIKQSKRAKLKKWIRNLNLKEGGYFYIEDLQPEILNKFDRFNYYLLSRIFSSIALSVAVGFFLAGPFQYISAGIIAGIVITFISISNPKSLISSFLDKNRKMIFVLNNFIFGIPIAIILILFFGFTTPRYEEEMLFNGLFAPTEANVGVFMSLFFGILFGQRDLWQAASKDIRPVEKISIDLKKIFRYGVIGGVFVGLLLLISALIIIEVLDFTTFKDWVDNKNYDINIYVLAFITGLTFGFPLVGLIGWFEDDTALEKRVKKKYFTNPNYGIIKSVFNALRASLAFGIFTVISFSIFFGILSGGEFNNIYKGFKAGIGGAIFAFLWFGGFDIIHHYVLRIIIAINNYGPFSYARFLRTMSMFRFIRLQGASYTLRHPTLVDYFQESKNPLGKKSLKPRFLFVLIFGIIFTIILLSFKDKYISNAFWSDPYGLVIQENSTIFKKIDKNEIVLSGITKADTIEIKARGRALAGTFTGKVTPGGTEAGFMGFEIGNTYDCITTDNYRHCALLVKKPSSDKWIQFPKDNTLNFLNSERVLRLAVNPNDTLEFVVNDAEYHNNKNPFKIEINKPKESNIKIVSHRGAAGLAPENTLLAVKKGLSLNPDFIEIDVRMTSDDIVVLMHDKRINRTTHGKGLVHKISWDSLQKIAIKHEGEEFTPIKVPSLEDVLKEFVESDVDLIIELKNPSMYNNIDEKIHELIEKYHLKDQIHIFSFDKDYVRNFKVKYPQYNVGIFYLSLLDSPKLDSTINMVGVHYLTALLFPKHIKNMQKKGNKVFVWGVNSLDTMQSLLDLSPDGIITDHPDLLKEVLGN